MEQPGGQRQNPDMKRLREDLAYELTLGQEKQAKAIREGMDRMNNVINIHLADMSGAFQKSLSNIETLLERILAARDQKGS
jgi:hypothetical protein